MLRTFLFSLLFLVSSVVYAQQLTDIQGKVTDFRGIPLYGASISTLDGKFGTISDLNGIFRLRFVDSYKQLVISYVGMRSQRVTVRPDLHIVMKEKVNELDETIVTAYGSSRKSAFTGAASEIKREKLDNRPLTVVTNALEGLAAGVSVGEENGQPGYMSSVRIRGFGSVNAGNNPVYVVDGAIYYGELCDLNPEDIESVTILKDAVATALYGSSAGNGVILITMKSARTERPILRFTMKQGFNSRAISEYDRVGVRDYYPLEWEMLRNGFVSGGMEETEANSAASAGIYGKLNANPFRGIDDDKIVLSNGQLNPAAEELLYDDLNWEDALMRKGYRGEYILSYEQRNKVSDLYASLSYLKEEGYIVNSGLERFSGRVNGNIRPISWLKTGITLNVSRTSGNLANTQDNPTNLANPFYFTRYIGPVYPIHAYDRTTAQYITDPSGQRVYDYGERGAGASFGDRNIVEETLCNKNSFERNGLNGKVYADVYLLSGLKATVNLTVDSYDYRKKKYEMKGPASSPGRLYATALRTTSVTASELINYTRSFSRHRITALCGHESYMYKYESFSGNRQDQLLEGIRDMSNFLTIGRLDSYTDTYRKEGYFIQGDYGYDGRYYLTVAYRRDGSSRFREDHRWGNFWSAGVAYRIDREGFFKQLQGIDYLKIRASFGETGNDKILQSTNLPNTFTDNFYPYQSLYNIGVNNALEPGIAFSSFGNGELKWETQVAWDVAVEFGIMGRFSGCIEYFQKNSRDLLFNVPQVLSSGVSSLWMNVGEVSNRGIELTLDASVIQGKYWNWKLGVTATFLNNRITQMPSTQPEIVDGTRKLKKGKSIYNHWLKEYRGVNPETGDAQFTFDNERYKWNSKVCYVNAEGDSLTYYSTYAKYHYAGSPIPKVYGGVTTALSFRNIELSAILAYSLGGKVYNTGYSYLMTNGKYGQAFHRDMLSRWQKPGDQTEVPRLDDAVANKRLGSISSAAQANAISDRWLFDASYLNVRNITLSYRLSGKWMSRIGVTGTSVYLSGENLYFLSAMRGMDPRQAYKGIITVANTPARTFTLGINVTL